MIEKEHTSTIYCDRCQDFLSWDSDFSYTDLKRFAREHGWSCGKKHLYKKCKELPICELCGERTGMRAFNGKKYGEGKKVCFTCFNKKTDVKEETK